MNLKIVSHTGTTTSDRARVMSKLSQLNKASNAFWSPYYQNARTAVADFHSAKRRLSWDRFCDYAKGLPDNELVKMCYDLFNIYGEPSIEDLEAFSVSTLLCIFKSGKPGFINVMKATLSRKPQIGMTSDQDDGVHELLLRHEFQDVLLLVKHLPFLFDHPNDAAIKSYPPDLEVLRFFQAHSQFVHFASGLKMYLLRIRQRDLTAEFVKSLITQGFDVTSMWRSWDQATPLEVVHVLLEQTSEMDREHAFYQLLNGYKDDSRAYIFGSGSYCTRLAGLLDLGFVPGVAFVNHFARETRGSKSSFFQEISSSRRDCLRKLLPTLRPLLGEERPVALAALDNFVAELRDEAQFVTKEIFYNRWFSPPPASLMNIIYSKLDAVLFRNDDDHLIENADALERRRIFVNIRRFEMSRGLLGYLQWKEDQEHGSARKVMQTLIEEAIRMHLDISWAVDLSQHAAEEGVFTEADVVELRNVILASLEKDEQLGPRYVLRVKNLVEDRLT